MTGNGWVGWMGGGVRYEADKMISTRARAPQKLFKHFHYAPRKSSGKVEAVGENKIQN